MDKVHWTDLKGKPITSLPKGCYGFVYILTFTDDMMYIGKKQTTQMVTQPANVTGKKPKGFREELRRIIYRDPLTGEIAKSKAVKAKLKRQGVKGTTETYYRVAKEAPWKRYEGSSKENEGKTLTKKQIIAYSSNKTTLTYLETRYQFVHDVASNKKFTNLNILGKFYSNCLEGWTKS